MFVDKSQAQSKIGHLADTSLSFLLIAAGIVIIGIGLLPDHRILKVIALAYVLLP